MHYIIFIKQSLGRLSVWRIAKAFFFGGDTEGIDSCPASTAFPKYSVKFLRRRPALSTAHWRKW